MKFYRVNEPNPLLTIAGGERWRTAEWLLYGVVKDEANFIVGIFQELLLLLSGVECGMDKVLYYEPARNKDKMV